MGNNKKKIAVIICLPERNEYKNIIEELKKAYIPDGYIIDIMVYTDVTNRVCNINNAIRETDAQYKVFFNTPVKNINGRIFHYIIDCFKMEQSVGVLGVLGSELPIDADYRKANKVYGAHCDVVGEKLYVMRGDNPLFYQQVSTVEFSFFAINVDVTFDESMGEYFCLPAYCSAIKQSGHKTIVAMQNENDLWITFKEKSTYEKAKTDLLYESQREKFYKKYYKIFLPIVSILIPTYNDTYFFKQTLESAIAQDYPNIEILIGDDSTTSDVKNFIKPYLGKYDNIYFYHHGAPLGGRGDKNINFLLGKCRGEYVKVLFHDDILCPNCISEMMKYYARDMTCKIGIISSVRDAIDEKGNVLGIVSPWIPNIDAVITAKIVVEKMLHSGLNFLGEYSTVLIRKKLLWSDEIKGYCIGYYNGFLDKHLGDVSLWLRVASQGGDCIFIRKRLSYFRIHSNQNTYDNNIQVGARLDWYAMCLLSYDYKNNSGDADECYHIIKVMDEKFQPVISNTESKFDDEFRYMYMVYKQIHECVLENNKNMIFSLVEKYIKKNCNGLA